MSVLNNLILNIWDSKKWRFLIKALVGILLFSYLYHSIVKNANQIDFSEVNLSKDWILLLSSILLLSILNWGIEAKKWHLVRNISSDLSFFNAFRSVLAGLSTGLVTPNRLGNFIGRNAYVESKAKKKAIYDTQLNNLSQFIISVSVGFISFLIIQYKIGIQFSILYPISIIIILIIGIYFYFSIASILNFPFLKKMFKKEEENILHIANISTLFKLKILLLSLLRYSVFILQYYLLFQLFSFQNNWIDISLHSSVVFLFTTLTPSIFFGKLLVRESAAIFVFSWLLIPIQIILPVSLSLWFINLAIPGIIGFNLWQKKIK